MLYGRKDVSLEDECAIDGVLPGTCLAAWRTPSLMPVISSATLGGHGAVA